MKYCFFFLILVFSKPFPALAQPGSTGERALAFPGAEGFGKYVTGGRGGKVLVVTNLNDKGPGSLREAAHSIKPAIIVFRVSGTIHLNSDLVIRSDKTIAGQSAPGDGICVADYPVSLGGDNIIIRFMRFRLGDRYQNQGMVDKGGADDAFNALRRKNIIIDHCSMSWSTDEVCSVYAGDSTTIQWNIISEPLNYSYHFEKGDTDFERHGFGSILGGAHTTAHHNLYAHCTSRTPRFNGIRTTPVEMVDFRNNVIYNWGTNNVHAGEGGIYNIVNNYYKYGPSTAEKVKFRVANPYKSSTIPFGKFFIHGNFVDGNKEVSSNNWLGVKMGKGNEGDTFLSKVPMPFPWMDWPAESAENAYRSVLKNAGSVFPVRDTLDMRIIKDVENRTGKIIDVQGGFPHGTPYDISRIAWPELRSSSAMEDTDNDGMPDAWEIKHHLNPTDARDASGYILSKQFTNIEVYLENLLTR